LRAWLALGNAVQAGSTGIRIWATGGPSNRALESWEQQGADPESKPRIGWRLTAVFAQDQVAPLPPPAEPAPIDPPIVEISGGSHAPLVARLNELAGEIGAPTGARAPHPPPADDSGLWRHAGW
jgi:hypothetical protein